MKIYKDISEKTGKKNPRNILPSTTHFRNLPYTSIANNISELNSKNQSISMTLDRVLDPNLIGPISMQKNNNENFRDSHFKKDFQKKNFQIEKEVGITRMKKISWEKHCSWSRIYCRRIPHIMLVQVVVNQ